MMYKYAYKVVDGKKLPAILIKENEEDGYVCVDSHQSGLINRMLSYYKDFTEEEKPTLALL